MPSQQRLIFVYFQICKACRGGKALISQNVLIEFDFSTTHILGGKYLTSRWVASSKVSPLKMFTVRVRAASLFLLTERSTPH